MNFAEGIRAFFTGYDIGIGLIILIFLAGWSSRLSASSNAAQREGDRIDREITQRMRPGSGRVA